MAQSHLFQMDLVGMGGFFPRCEHFFLQIQKAFLDFSKIHVFSLVFRDSDNFPFELKSHFGILGFFQCSLHELAFPDYFQSIPLHICSESIKLLK